MTGDGLENFSINFTLVVKNVVFTIIHIDDVVYLSVVTSVTIADKRQERDRIFHQLKDIN